MPSWLRPAVDVAMTAVLLAQMVPGKTGNPLHELSGMVFAVLFVIHHVLNHGWWHRLGRRRTPRARVTMASDVLLMLAVLGTIASGVLMSRSAVPVLSVPAVAHVARPLHGACAYASLMAAALHAGLHVGAIRGYARRRGPTHVSRAASAMLAVASLAMGAWAFVRLGVLARLLGRPSFPDAVTPLGLQLACHLALVAPFAVLGARIASQQALTMHTTKKGDA